MKKVLSLMFCCLLMSVFVLAKGDRIPKGSTVFIVPMEEGLDQFISAEMIKQKVPVSIVLDEKEASYIITGTAVKKEGNNKWYHYLSGAAGRTDTMQSSISLIDKNKKALLWAGNAGDRSAWWGVLKRGGERKVAIRLVREFKKGVF